MGPNQWDDGYEPATPVWLRDWLDPFPQSASPKQFREVLAAGIRQESDGAWEGVVMSPEDQRKGEDDADYFARLEKEHNVEAYFFFVPNQAKILGTVFEGGMLRRDVQWGKNPRIAVFVEKGFLTLGEDGDATLNVKGKRTTYLKSLLRVSNHIEEWDTVEDAFEQMMRRARTNWTL